MVNQTETTPHIPHLHIDSEAIATRLATLADVEPCPHCGNCGLSVTEALSDVADLMVEVARLYAALIETRRESANRLAAVRAALGAAADGEADPWGFLRDELAESPGALRLVDERGDVR
ncbi:MAG: hypothetical protein ACRDTE_27050 [Pseudonocardiaceae bacterium]